MNIRLQSSAAEVAATVLHLDACSADTAADAYGASRYDEGMDWLASAPAVRGGVAVVPDDPRVRYEDHAGADALPDRHIDAVCIGGQNSTNATVDPVEA